jgi:predicted transcriptional regulator
MAANPQNVKQYLHALADQLPEGATIDEALYHLVLRREIEAGLADSDAGRTTPVEELLARRGIRE